MKIEIDRYGLEILVKGSNPHYNQFNNPLVKKAGHRFSDQYGSSWKSLNNLTDDELYQLYIICKNSWT